MTTKNLDIVHSAETVVKTNLRSLGYFNIEFEVENAHSLNVIAEGTLRSILLKVLIGTNWTEILSNQSAIQKIKNDAHSRHKEAWMAFLSVGADGKIQQNIEWKNLEKYNLP
jgi:hypothetical protein